MMPTPQAEEIIKTAWSEAVAGEDALTVVQRHAPRIDALCLRLISANEEQWRRALRLEREARAKVERERDDPKINDAMLEEGADLLPDAIPYWEDQKQIVAEIYRAMFARRPR